MPCGGRSWVEGSRKLFSSVSLPNCFEIEKNAEETLFYLSKEPDWNRFFTLTPNFLGRLSGDQKFGRDKGSLS